MADPSSEWNRISCDTREAFSAGGDEALSWHMRCDSADAHRTPLGVERVACVPPIGDPARMRFVQHSSGQDDLSSTDEGTPQDLPLAVALFEAVKVAPATEEIELPALGEDVLADELGQAVL